MIKPRKIKRSQIVQTRSKFDKYSGLNSIPVNQIISEEEQSISQGEVSLNRHVSSPRASEFAQIHKSVKGLDTINTVSSVGIPKDHNLIGTDSRLEFLRGKEILQ